MSPEELRRKRNAETRAKFLRGESLSLSDPTDQFFPQRQAIPKDENALKLLFGSPSKPALTVCKSDCVPEDDHSQESNDNVTQLFDCGEGSH